MFINTCTLHYITHTHTYTQNLFLFIVRNLNDSNNCMYNNYCRYSHAA